MLTYLWPSRCWPPQKQFDVRYLAECRHKAVQDNGYRAVMTKPCLLIIDLQNDFLDQWDQREVDRLIRNTNLLINQFRRSCFPLIWVRQEFKPDLSDAFLEMRAKSVALTVEGTRGAEFHPELDWRETDRTIIKKRYSAFFGTDLDQLLQELGADQIVICGINTHACIRTAAIDAYQRDFKVVLSTDCIGSYDSEHARVSLDYMTGKIAAVATAAEIAAHLAQSAKAI
ncbi:MAG: cysteine hydrolase family protein [Allorhizobium sp.]